MHGHLYPKLSKFKHLKLLHWQGVYVLAGHSVSTWQFKEWHHSWRLNVGTSTMNARTCQGKPWILWAWKGEWMWMWPISLGILFIFPFLITFYHPWPYGPSHDTTMVAFPGNQKSGSAARLGCTTTCEGLHLNQYLYKHMVAWPWPCLVKGA